MSPHLYLPRKPLSALIAHACLLMASGAAYGAACPAGSGGEILVDNLAVTATCTVPTAQGIHITYSGLIINTSANPAILADTGVDITGVTNDGAVQSIGIGLYVHQASVDNDITNEGIISAIGTTPGQVSEGIRLENATVLGAVVNRTGASITADAGNAIHIIGGQLSGGISNQVNAEISGASGYAALLIEGSAQVSGGIDNAGHIGPSAVGPQNGSGLQIINSSVSGNINNSGTVDARGNYSAIQLDGATVYGSSASVPGELRNSGSIDATGASIGIELRNNSQIGTIINTNSGVISAGDYGISVSANSQVTGGIVNDGVINATDALNLANTGSAFTVSNSGALEGNVVLGINRLDLIGSATVSGTVSGGSGSVVNLGSDLAHTTNFTAAGNFTGLSAFNINQGSQLNSFNGLAIAATTMTNAGTFSIAAGHTVNLTGNYVQAAGGVFRTGLSSATTYGKLAVSGNVDMSASNNIDVNVVGSPVLAIGTVISGVITAGGTLTTASGITVTDNSYLFNFRGVRNGNSLDLVIVSPNAASSANAQNAVNENGNPSAVGAARVLDTLITDGASGDMSQVITALGQLGSAKEVSDAVSQTLPVAVGATAASVANTISLTNRIVQARLASNRGLSSGDAVAERGVWGKPFGSWGNQRARDGVPGYNANSSGIMFGADGAVNANDRIGAAFMYAKTNLDASGASAQSADINMYQLMLYGSHSLDPATDINWQADYGMSRTRSHRTITFGSLDRVANGKYDGTSWHLGAGVSHLMPLGEVTSLTPSVRLDYIKVNNQAYTETGADALNLSVEKQDAKQFIVSSNARLSHALSEGMTVSAELGGGYDFLSKRNSVSSTFVGGGTSFLTQGAAPSRAFVRAGAGWTSLASTGLEMSLRYDIEARQAFTDQSVSLKLRQEF